MDPLIVTIYFAHNHRNKTFAKDYVVINTKKYPHICFVSDPWNPNNKCEYFFIERFSYFLIGKKYNSIQEIIDEYYRKK